MIAQQGSDFKDACRIEKVERTFGYTLWKLLSGRLKRRLYKACVQEV